MSAPTKFSPSATSPIHKGDLVDELIGIVNVTNAKFGIHLERYPIDEICALIADIDPAELPHCESCEKPYGLFPCKNCRTFYCQGCKPSHVCGSGPDAGQGRF